MWLRKGSREFPSLVKKMLLAKYMCFTRFSYVAKSLQLSKKIGNREVDRYADARKQLILNELISGGWM